MSRLNTPTTIDAAPTATHTSLKAVEKLFKKVLLDNPLLSDSSSSRLAQSPFQCHYTPSLTSRITRRNLCHV
jgi:hypothetical protein